MVLFRAYYSLGVASVGVTSPLTRGRVKLTPSWPADAPRSLDSLALGPRVTVLEHPIVSSVIAAISVTSVFMLLVKNRLLRLLSFDNPSLFFQKN